MDAALTLKKNSYLIGKLFLRYLIPSILSLLASSLNTLIDTIIVSNFTLKGGLEAMSIVAPVNLLYMTLSSTVCVGASICFSTAVGEKNFSKARAYFGFAIVAVLTMGIVITAVFMPLTTQIATLLGAKDEILDYARDYLFFYFIGGVFVMLLYVPHNFSKALGKPNVPLVLLSVMAIVNIVLTYIMVAILKMGTGGAALATSIASAVAFVVGCFFIFSRSNRLSPTFFKLPFKEWKTTFFCGSAAGFNNLIRFLTVFGINTIISYFLVSSLLSSYTIARSVQDLLQSIVLGISQSVMPLVALFNGEKDNSAIRTVLKKASVVGLCAVTVSVLLAIILNVPLQKLFGVENSDANRLAIILMCVALIPSFCNNLLASYFAALKKYKFSQLIMLIRVVFTLSACLLLAKFAGTNAIWWGFFAAEGLALAVMAIVIFAYAKKHADLDNLLLIKKYDNLSNRLLFSIRANENEIVSASEKVALFLQEKKLSAKKLMRASLAIEELMISITNQKLISAQSYVDINIFYDADGIIMRFRYGGKRNNPLDLPNEVDSDDEKFGLHLLKKTLKDTEHSWVFGLNNLVVII